MADAVLNVVAQTDRAIKDIATFQKKSVRSLQVVEKSISVLGAAAGVAAGVFAGKQILDGISAVTEAASIQEDAINSLNTALQLSGEFSEEASQDMQDFATSIQQATKFGDEAILQQLSLAKAFGASNEQAKLITESAVELAAATGKSLDEATRQVSKTLGGFAGELGEVNPAIKALTQEQLRNGAAAELLLKQYGGSAAAQVNTFSGALQQTSNTFGDLQEELGFLITQNPVVIKGIKIVGDAFSALIKVVQENSGGISEFIANAFKGIINIIPGVVRSLKFVTDAFKGIGLGASSAIIVVVDFIKALLRVDIVRDVFNGVIDAFKALAGGAIAAFSVILDGLSALGVDVGDFQKSVDELGISLVESIGSDAADDIVPALDAMRDSAVNFGEDTEMAFQGVEKAIDVVAGTAQKVADEVNAIDLAEQIQTQLNTTANVEVEGGFLDNITDTIQEAFEKFDFRKVGASFVASALKGVEGARSAIREGAAAIGEAFFPGFGGAIGQIVGELTKGPEAVRELVDQFVAALPILVEALADALPVVIERLAEKSDEIIEALVNAAPNIIIALVRNIPQIVSAIIRALPEIIRALTIGLAENIAKQVFNLEFSQEKLNRIIGSLGERVNSFFKGFLNLPSRFLDQIGKGLKKIIDRLNPAKAVQNVGDKVSSGIKKVGEFLGFNEGGIVPGIGNKDTVPTVLTPGELVVPKDDVSKLRNFLNNQGAGGNAASDALLAQAVQLLSQPMQVSTVAEVDGEALAEIMLNLSRQNARTVA